VLGLGRFGSALAQTLIDLGHEVLGVDVSEGLVQRYSTVLTHTAEADTTDVDALRQLGVGDFSCAVVAIGTDLEASILTTAALDDLGVGNIWAKAISESHGRILERVGAHHVVFPEREMGERVAHLVTGRMMDYLEIDPGFALVETRPPEEMIGRTLADSGVRGRYGVTVVCIKPAGGAYTYATPETVVGPGDTLLVAGESRRAESFSALS
jgi:trk system potassium uptake protein TrkA